jgi:cell surface protein SprA
MQMAPKSFSILPFMIQKCHYLNVQGEWALMMPNPNKRTSEIASDNNSPVVYIDDFEAAQRYISLGLTPTQWQHSSAPVDNDIDTTGAGRNFYRGRMFWYQYFLPRVPIIDIYPNNQNYIQGQQFQPTLYIDFNPDFRGIYNMNPDFIDTLDGQYYDPANAFSANPINRKKIWGGNGTIIIIFLYKLRC